MQQPRAANREGISRLPAGYRWYSVTIELPLSAETFEAELKEDDEASSGCTSRTASATSGWGSI
jgi:hypothetical protein